MSKKEENQMKVTVIYTEEKEFDYEELFEIIFGSVEELYED